MGLCIVCSGEIPEGSRKDRKYCSKRCTSNSTGLSWRSRNRDKIKEKNRIDNLFTEKRMLTRIKSRCKIKGIPFDLNLEDIIIPTHCPILGIELTPNHGRSGYFDDSPSLDRIKPEGGYLKGNVRVISNRANMLKSNATVAEMELVLKDLIRIGE